jgi:hypothetical protein
MCASVRDCIPALGHIAGDRVRYSERSSDQHPIAARDGYEQIVESRVLAA